MRYLGIDYGGKRVGIALSDEGGTLAFPKFVLKADFDLLSAVMRIINDEKVREIVIGESRDFSGKENRIMTEIRSFKSALEKASGLPVHFEPEFMTSRQAEHIQGKEAATDASAAALILQSFIDKKKNAS